MNTLECGPRNNSRILIFALVAAVLIPPQLMAQAPKKDAVVLPLKAMEKDVIAAELEYAERLANMELPDFAMTVLAKVNGGGWKADVMKVRCLGAMRKFKEALAIADAQPDKDGGGAWTMKLMVADSYFAWTQYTNAQEIYETYFTKYPAGPTPDTNKFYVDSAYRYARLLLLMGADRKAIDAFNYALKAKMEPELERQLKAEKAELLVKLAERMPGDKDKFLAEASKLAEDLMWKQDIWFGKGVTIFAHVKILNGDMDGAKKMLDDKTIRATLESIDKIVTDAERDSRQDLSGMSPIAETKYLLAVMMQTQAEKLLASGGDREKAKELLLGKVTKSAQGKASNPHDGAYPCFIDVFVNYSSTTWAADAGTRAGKVRDTLRREFNVWPEFRPTDEQLKRMEKAQYTAARKLLNQRQWENAAGAYMAVLKNFPEGDLAVDALSSAATCYVELGDEIMADTVIRHLVERYGKTPATSLKAGNELLGLAKAYGAKDNRKKSEEIQRMFFAGFEKHPRRANLVLQFGDQCMAAKDYKGAGDYYLQFVRDHTNSPMRVDALLRLANAYDRLNDRSAAIKTLEEAMALAKAGDKLGGAVADITYRLADQYRRLGPRQVPEALAMYDDVLRMVSDPGRKRGDRDDELVESARFYRSLCLTAMTAQDDKEKEKNYRIEAAAGFTDLVAKNPSSRFVPAALLNLGTINMHLGRMSEARKVFEQIKKDHKASPEARQVPYKYATALLQLDMRQEAVAAFKEMLDGNGAAGLYTNWEIFTAGNELLKAKENELALMAFGRVLDGNPRERGLADGAMAGKGRALVELKKPEECVKMLEQFMKTCSNSYYSAQVSCDLVKAYGDLQLNEPDEAKRIELFNKARELLVKIRKTERQPAGQLRADLIVTDFFIKKSQAEERAAVAAKTPEDKARMLEKSRKYRGEALAKCQSVVMLSEPADPAARQVLEDIYRRCISLLAEDGKWDKVLQNADKYFATYANPQYETEIRQLKIKAMINVDPKSITKPVIIEREPGTNAAPVAGAGDKG
ncbi:MAG: hypothetical protein C0404_03935 [Verrucomicrobia bacterium]|nr:hypothetical protein [Verrucomicrobiota bacterium]